MRQIREEVAQSHCQRGGWKSFPPQLGIKYLRSRKTSRSNSVPCITETNGLGKLAMSSISNTKPAPASPPSKPIDVLQTQSSLLYTNLHPVLLLSLLLFSFKTLVADPVNTLLGLVPTIAILQAIYCVLCLPSAGQTPPTAPKAGQKRKPAKPAQDIWARVVVRESNPRSPIQTLTNRIACVSLSRPHVHTLGASIIHHSHPFWRTSHNPPTTHAPSRPSPRRSHDTAAILCSWIRYKDLVEDCQFAIACRRSLWNESGRMFRIMDRCNTYPA